MDGQRVTRMGHNQVCWENQSCNRAVGIVSEGIAEGAEGLGFESQVGLVGYNVANNSPPLRCFFVAVLRRRYAMEMGPATRYTLS